jgi:hypothetical protein
VPLDEDDFEVLLGHLTDSVVGDAPLAAHVTVEQLLMVVVGGEAPDGGCRVGTSIVYGGSSSATPARWKTGSQSPFIYAFLDGDYTPADLKSWYKNMLSCLTGVFLHLRHSK